MMLGSVLWAARLLGAPGTVRGVAASIWAAVQENWEIKVKKLLMSIVIATILKKELKLAVGKSTNGSRKWQWTIRGSDWLIDLIDFFFFLKQKQLQKLNIRPPPPPAGQSSPVQVSLSPFLRPSGEGEAPVSNLHVSTFIHLLLNRFLIIITIIIYIYLYIYIHIYVYVLHWFALSFQCQSPGPADSAPPTGGCALNCRLTEKTGF